MSPLSSVRAAPEQLLRLPRSPDGPLPVSHLRTSPGGGDAAQEAREEIREQVSLEALSSLPGSSAFRSPN